MTTPDLLDAETRARLIDFYKLFSDATRLRLVGLLALGPATPGALASDLGERETSVARHLARLLDAGLVTEEAVAGGSRYALDVAVLGRWNAAVFPRLTTENPALEGADARERKVLAAFLDGERIRSVPSQRSKLLVVLGWLVERFAPDERYPEATVNEIISQHHQDFATWRRLLVDHGLMRREGGIYWRV